MSLSIGSIVNVIGKVNVKHLDGSVEELSEGSGIFVGDIVMTSGASFASVVLVNGKKIPLNPESHTKIDKSITLVAEVIKQIIGADDIDKLDTAAGKEGKSSLWFNPESITQRNGVQNSDLHVQGALAGTVHGSNSINGGSTDEEFLRGLQDPFAGTSGNDTINGTNGDDTIFGQDGDDIIYGNAGDDVLYGGDGNDTIFGGDGDDVIDGGNGNDTLNGGAGDDTIYGEDGNDVINGGDGDDYLDGGNGDDTIHGNDGNDTILGGDGDDTLYGDDGDDVIDAGNGNDTIYGGNGNDTLNGGAGDDTIYGEDGNDVINGGDGDDYLDGGNGDDTIHGNDGNDTILGGDGDDTLYGDLGNDILDGGNGDDIIFGGEGDDTIHGNGGNDTIYGEGGNDTLYGDEGDDTLFGGDGNDVLYGGDGENVIDGGAGNDVVVFEGDKDDYTISYGDDTIIVTANDGSSVTEISNSELLVFDDETIQISDYDNVTISLDSISDNIINLAESKDETLSITGSTTAINGAEINIYVSGTLFGTTYADNGSFELNIEPAVFNAYPDSNYEVRADVVKNLAGEVTQSSQIVELDRTLGDGEVISIDSLSNDSGLVGDFITNDTTPTVSGSFNNDGENILTVRVDGTTYDSSNGLEISGNTWSLNLDLSDGAYDLVAVLVDNAGNTSSVNKTIEIDTNTDGINIVLDDVSHGFLNAAEVGETLTLTGSSNAADGTEVTITLNGVSFTSTTLEKGLFSVNVDTADMAAYSDGSYTVKASLMTDTAGNSVSATQEVIKDTHIGTISIDGGEHMTTAQSNVTLSGTISGDYVDGDSVNVNVDGDIYDVSDTIIDGKWQLDISGLDEDVHSIRVISSDVAGNSDIETQELTVSTEVDNALLNLNEISGNYINAQETHEPLVISGTSSGTNGTQVTFLLDGSALKDTSGNDVIATVTDGIFSITLPADIFNGYEDKEYIVTAKANVGGTNVEDTETVTLDTLVGETGSDVSISLDNLDDNVLNFTETQANILVTGSSIGTSEGSAVIITFNNQTVTTTIQSGGSFSAYVPVGSVNEGDILALQAAVVSDKAGNLAYSDSLDISIDLSAGTLSSDTASVSESGLDTGSNPSIAQRQAVGNLFDNDTQDSDSVISSISFEGTAGSVWSENSNILVLDTPSGILYVTIANTTVSGKEYSAGDYFYELQAASNVANETFSYTVSDTAGNVASSNLTISIADDSVADLGQNVDKYLNADETSIYTTNLVLTIDTSGSMIWDADGSAPGDKHFDLSSFKYVSDYDESTIRIDLAKEALNNLIDQYAALGNVNVKIISFDSTATASGWFSDITDAKNYVNSLSADGGTMYDSAIAKVEETSDYADANNTLFYFISDGQPNSGGGLTLDEYNVWNSYTDSYIDKTFAIGVGSSVNQGELNNISDHKGEMILIDSITDLNDALVQTVNNTIVSGNVISFDADGTATTVGADGGHIESITVGTNTYSYDASNPTQNITTDLGGSLNINFDDGSYSYTIDYKESIAGQSEIFNITTTTDDGETSSGSITLHLETTDNENIVYQEGSVMDGGLGFDTLVLAPSDTIDFDLAYDISNIERIDLNANLLENLNPDDVLSMSDEEHIIEFVGEGDIHADTNVWSEVSSTATTTTYNGIAGADTTVSIVVDNTIILEES